MPINGPRRFLISLALACCTLTGWFCQPGAAAERYDLGASEVQAAKPGQILRIEPLAGGAPERARGYRVIYRSVGLRGEAIAVSGAFIVPEGPAPASGRPIVAWAHPTSGVDDRCAPTLRPEFSGSVPGLDDMIDRGYAIVATDYEGLGVPGDHPYLIGVSEARSILDSVRAIRELRDAGASNRFAIWGHSQGGHAALFAGQMASVYAPELQLVGIAAAAPATDLAALFEADRGTESGNGLTAYALYSWSKVFQASYDSLIAPQARQSVETLAHDCLLSLSEFIKEGDDEQPLTKNFLLADPTKIEPWRKIIAENSAGGARAGAPLFIAQGTADTTVRPAITQQFVTKLCRDGETVRLKMLSGVSHVFAAQQSASLAVSWMADRFQGRAAPNDCKP